MRYESTRGEAPELEFDDVLLTGLAVDGGLYVPTSIPKLDATPDASAGYASVAAEVVRGFVGDGIVGERLDALCREAYAGFSHADVAPLRPMGDDTHLLELFWGPTLSFKDYALQLVGRMFDAVLSERGERITVLGATSGDTGSAAIAGCQGRDAIDVVILFPDGRVSDFQRRQMTTVHADNVTAVAVSGTFDDCQDLVKAAFGDPSLRSEHSLAAVNSINWARVMSQTAYYWWTAAQLGHPFTVAVPTGNFGNVLAAWVAREMGAPIERLLIGTNANHGLVRLIEHGRMGLEPVVATLAPAMDIAVSSNLERYLFEAMGGSAEATGRAISLFRSEGELVIDEVAHERLRSDFSADWSTDGEIESTMAQVFDRHGQVLDPHTAVGWRAAERLRRPGEHVVVVATAHPAKFADAVRSAIGSAPDIPDRAADVMQREERWVDIGADLSELAAVLDRR